MKLKHKGTKMENRNYYHFEIDEEPLKPWENAVVYAVSGACWIIVGLGYPFYLAWRLYDSARRYTDIK